MHILRKYRKIILLLTVPVILIYLSNSLINRHNHEMRGYIFTHSHPFKKTTDDQSPPLHTHTDAEILLLDMLSDMDILLLISLLSLLIAFGLLGFLGFSINESPLSPLYSLFLSRGPPILNYDRKI